MWTGPVIAHSMLGRQLSLIDVDSIDNCHYYNTSSVRVTMSPLQLAQILRSARDIWLVLWLISMVVQVANSKLQMENANVMTSLFDVTDVIVQRSAASWDQERSHQITHPPSVGPCLICLVMFQTRNGELNIIL